MKITVEVQSTGQALFTISNTITAMAAEMIFINAIMALAVYLTNLYVMEILTVGMDLMSGTAHLSITVIPAMSFR